MEDEEIVLVIDDNQIKSKKGTLMGSSDYFKVMFESDFMEKHQSVINLQDVNFKSLTIILTLINDEEYIVDDEDLLPVLQTACMLQFNRIRIVCIERITTILSVKNCLKVWYMAESLDLKPLYLKAKLLSLTEFEQIKDTDYILNLNLKQLRDYLANMYLCVKNEIDVFASCMKWWYENSSNEISVINQCDKDRLFYYFLTFVDFNGLSNKDIKEIMMYPDINTNDEITRILNNILKIRYCDLIDDKSTLPKEFVLLNCRQRVKNNLPCILMDTGAAPISYDNDQCLESTVKEQKPQTNKDVLLYNVRNSNFIKILSVPLEKHENLVGFHILGYKELVFLFGGEYHWGRGNWNSNFWVYDTIREKWERLTKMPFGRRHFESCIVDNTICIIGGTGNFRVLQDNMFWYNYKLNEWSQLISLPCSGLHIKCCEYRNQLFLLNIDIKCGYLYNPSTNDWVKLKINITESIEKCFLDKFLIFSYEDFICIKGSSFIKLKINDDKLEEISATCLNSNSSFIESVVSGNHVYSISKKSADVTSTIVFERYSVLNNTCDVIVESDTEEADIKLCGEVYSFNKHTKLFTLSHFTMVEESIYLTDFSL
ncbi:kelch protein [Holotrichia oblita]|uniref:Kelch protein n=1 Tax=Holotrichia oblita TaxID=644536 RepID=A0ACB9T6P0_HOLOL|nr:kelch protein [Holotrichia oblita]